MSTRKIFRPQACRILVVDDEDGLLFLMKNALGNEGFEVATANSGRQAFEWLEANPAELLLLDLNLGDMPALELIERLAVVGRSLPFIIITGRGDERTAVETMKVGALDYVMKDTGLLELLPSVVHRALSIVEREKALRLANAEQRRLEREVLQIGEAEKRRIGRELHDGLGQRLTALEFMSQGLARSLQAESPKLSKVAADISRHMRQAVSQIRRLSHGLAPVALEERGLYEALLELAETTKASGLPCSVTGRNPAVSIPSEVAIHLYRIAQEGISNTLKHSGASTMSLALQEAEGGLELTIHDNGRGLPSSRRSHRGMGLRLMKYRADLIGARLAIAGDKQSGLSITCTVPLSAKNPP